MKTPDGYSPIQGLPIDIGVDRPMFRFPDASLTLFGKADEKKLWGVVRFNDNFTGPPGHAHGGAQAYVLDEAMGTVCWVSDVPVVAKTIQMDFRKMVPLHKEHQITAEVKKVNGDHVLVTSELKAADGTVLATGLGHFHVLTYTQFSKLASHLNMDVSRWFPNK